MTPDLSPDDQKLVVLARAAQARIKSAAGAAVRDNTGRTYAGAEVTLPSLSLSAVEVAVAQAAAAGAERLEAVAVVGDSDKGKAAAADLGCRTLIRADSSGNPISSEEMS